MESPSHKLSIALVLARKLVKIACFGHDFSQKNWLNNMHISINRTKLAMVGAIPCQNEAPPLVDSL
jgi:hypothetical protein